MKNNRSSLTQIAILLIAILFYTSSAIAQYVYMADERALYVDDFITFDKDDVHINADFTILGNGPKENELLDYCKQNNITYLILYETHRISYRWNDHYDNNGTLPEYDQVLCNFINKAKASPYCIQHIGVAGYKHFDRYGTYNVNNFVTPPILLTDIPENLQSRFSFVTQEHPPAAQDLQSCA